MTDITQRTIGAIGDAAGFSQWVVCFGYGGGTVQDQIDTGPKHDTYEAALAEYESEKLKHQRNMVIVRLDVRAVVVKDGAHISFEDAYGV